MKTYVSTKGQLVIPAELRRKYGIKPGTRVEVIDRGDQIILQPITEEYVRKLRGSLKGGNALRVLEEERRKDKER
jgi:AbrB family looped-hinge helix DNA binding protein